MLFRLHLFFKQVLLIDSPNTKIAILIFSLFQEVEVLRKPFLEKQDAICNLSAIIRALVASLGMDYFHYTEKHQQGNTFGERFVNTIAAIFDKGYDQIITVDNDTLGLEKNTFVVL